MSERSSQQRKLASVGRSMASKLRKLLFLSLGTDGSTPGILHSILGVEILETVQQRADGMARGMQ